MAEEKQKVVTKDDKIEDQNPMEKLEDALVECGFGKFNIRLLVTTIISVFATTSVTTTSSYILPSAECDLNMTNVQKGLLNGIPFFGQLAASLFTGFITDAFGRKIFLIGGNIGIFVCSILEGSSQTYWMLVTVKFIDGLCLSLCFNAAAVMVAELTHRNIRNRVLLCYSLSMSLSIVMAALVAWAVLPQDWNFVLIKGYFELHSWNIYLYVNSLWSFLSAILYYFLPESPKFIMSIGQENEALKIIKDIYHENTGKPRETFPITSLNISNTYSETQKISMKKQMTSSLFEVKDLFRRPLVFRLLLFCTTTFTCLLTYSSLRLWYPQISTMIENYKLNNGEAQRFCVMIDDYTKTKVVEVKTTNFTESEICIPHISGSETYTNGLMLGFISLLFISISIFLVDYFGQKILMFATLLMCGICSGVLYWSNSSIQIAILFSATCGLMQTAFSLQHNILVRVFPTSVRAVAMSIVIMMGRIGSVLGNVIFPILLEAGCMVPFITLTCVTFSVASIVYFLPNPNKENKGTGDK